MCRGELIASSYHRIESDVNCRRDDCVCWWQNNAASYTIAVFSTSATNFTLNYIYLYESFFVHLSLPNADVYIVYKVILRYRLGGSIFKRFGNIFCFAFAVRVVYSESGQNYKNHNFFLPRLTRIRHALSHSVVSRASKIGGRMSLISRLFIITISF